jgi:hypothetical protein
MEPSMPTLTTQQTHLLQKWQMAQMMVAESRAEQASAYERSALLRRMQWATKIGAECMKAGLVNLM